MAASPENPAPADYKYKVTWMGDPKKPHQVRLRAALLDAERRLAALEAKCNSAHRSVVQACTRCLGLAQEEATRRAWYAAWDCLHQFDDEMLAAMTPEELAARWCSLRAEAEKKLGDTWRGKAASCLIKMGSGKKVGPEEETVPSLEIVRELHAQLTTAAQNQQHRLALFEDQTVPLVSQLLGLFVGGVLVVSIAVLSRAMMPGLLPWAEALVPGIFTGALGGLLSTAFSLGKFDLKQKIPEVRLGMWVTGMRSIVGAAVAIPVAILVESGYVKIEGLSKPFSTLAFCFIAGFSERWFLGLMTRLGDEKAQAEKK